jgi:hypothetical protein
VEEFMNMADAADFSKGGGDGPACVTNVFVPTRTATESACQERDRDANEDKASSDAGKDSSSYTSGDNSKNAVSAGPEPPSVCRMSPAASPKLKRSCSNIETSKSVPAEEFDLPQAKSRSYGDLIKALPSWRPLATTPSGGAPDASPTASVRSSSSADRVMLRKLSSRQVLPSRSRKLWWRLLMWSHRNLHRPGTPALLPSADAYGSAARQNDTLDAVTAATAREPKDKEVAVEEEPTNLPNQGVAFSAEPSSSALDRVSTWVNSIGAGSSFQVVDEDEEDVTEHDGGGAVVRTSCSEIVECSTAADKQTRAKDQAVQAGSIVQTFNAVASVAHITGMGLKAVPMIAAFSSLRAVNLSGNFIGNSSCCKVVDFLRSVLLSGRVLISSCCDIIG